MGRGIDVHAVLAAMPHFERFCSVDEVDALVERLRRNPAFTVETAGESAGGWPLHHVQFGSGSVKALYVAWPHANEPIGGLTAFSLLTLLDQGHPELIGADVEWHVAPCIDPDGARLNEAWTRRPFGLADYLKGFHVQDLSQQVEMTFPITYKRLRFDRPTRETLAFKSLIDRIRPDYLCSLHNASFGGGVWWAVSRDVGPEHRRALRELISRFGLAVKASPWSGFGLARYDDGVVELVTTRKRYDHLEKVSPEPESAIHWGTSSWDHLVQVKSDALAFVAEVPYAQHRADGSSAETGHNLRRLRLRMDADNLFVGSMILEEWDRVEPDLDKESAFYAKIEIGVVQLRNRLLERAPFSPRTIRDSLFNPAYSCNATEGEWFSLWFERFYVLCQGHEFVRLLEVSPQTQAVIGALERVRPIFDTALTEVAEALGKDCLVPIAHDTMAGVQFGSTLVGLNSLLDAR